MTCWIQYSILTFEQCGVTFSDADQKGVLSYEIEGRECQLPFGIGHLEEGELYDLIMLSLLRELALVKV